ncbi:MAG TPA: O-methyltransferase [Spirochaetota bacterium]|nr:O-methyltransferase [Spirochaetota bacterium]HOF32839.1 O-methyltransferase [Spirochaetota bacterium]HOR43706.1 O-methyltransferase [Spirochaetota bacterium]HPK55229.1 O-methyltransferase [Spirochaetota bacterium]
MEKTLGIDNELILYIRGFSKESPHLKKIRNDNISHPQTKMFITPEQVSFITFLIRSKKPSLIIEIGTFLGYSAVAMADAMPENCRIITIEKNETNAETAKSYFADYGYSDKVNLLCGKASDVLNDLSKDYLSEAGIIFIDADKKGYIDYYEKSIKLLEKGGIIIADNVLFYGNVADESDKSQTTEAIRNFNNHVFSDERVNACIVPIGDGLLLAEKK